MTNDGLTPDRPLAKSTLRPTPRLSTWKTIPPGEYRFGRGIDSLVPNRPGLVNSGGWHLSALAHVNVIATAAVGAGGCAGLARAVARAGFLAGAAAAAAMHQAEWAAAAEFRRAGAAGQSAVH